MPPLRHIAYLAACALCARDTAHTAYSHTCLHCGRSRSPARAGATVAGLVLGIAWIAPQTTGRGIP